MKHKRTVQQASPNRPKALLGWRLLALVYDALPVVALWMVLSLLANLLYAHSGGRDARAYIAPWTLWGWLLWLGCWLLAGWYATASWLKGGQTLGMRPWRLYVLGADGAPATRRALWLRYAWGSVSLLCGGLGFLWAWVDAEKRTWHDRFSQTRLYRLPKSG